MCASSLAIFLTIELYSGSNRKNIINLISSGIGIAALSIPLIKSMDGTALNSPYKIDLSDMSLAKKMRTLELLSIDKKHFNEPITENTETIDSIIIEKENKDSKTKKYITYPLVAAAGIGVSLFMLFIISISTY